MRYVNVYASWSKLLNRMVESVGEVHQTEGHAIEEAIDDMGGYMGTLTDKGVVNILDEEEAYEEWKAKTQAAIFRENDRDEERA